MRTPFARRARLVALLSLVTAAPLAGQSAVASGDTLTYRLDLRDRADDRFHVTLAVDGLGPEQAVYQFAATAPGTYQVMDVGRFVEGFTAIDAEGREIPVERVSTNQFRIARPADVRRIEYAVAETWDTPVDEHPIYPMAGTSMEADHVLVNGQDVFGYPTGMQESPIEIHLTVPEGWKVGTALERTADGAYRAETFDQLVDSPILTGGTLTEARTEVTGVPIEIFTYSAGGGIASADLLTAMEDMLEAAGEYLGALPVDHYVFLYHFEGQPAPGAIYGAWEHSYSSEYVFPDVPFSPQVGQIVTDVAAHEFLHVVTPLNIHSEIIETFDFVEPVPSRHLWLYEGVTEWEAHMIQLRAGLKPLDAYLAETAQKIANDRRFDPALSLEQLSLSSYTDEGQKQYPNIYERGAVVAGLLDIRLLELSHGESGLRELILRLADRYGKSRPFPDAGLYQAIADMTDPAILDFFQRYVESAEPLPVAEYYARLGIRFVDDPDQPRFEVMDDITPEQAALRAAGIARRADST